MTETAGSLRRRARALIEGVHRDGASLEGEYPLVFGQGSPGELVTIEDEGELRAACGVLVRDLVVDSEPVRIGLIGSVSTDPAWRGHGYGARLLEQAENQLRDAGCLAAFLWADEASFYTRRGWSEGGAEWVYVLCEENGPALPAAGPAVVRTLAEDDVGALHRLYLDHGARVDRTADETRALLRGPGVETLVLERGHDIDAFACMGRGPDLARCVHEWGGAPRDVLSLVAEHHARLVDAGEPGPVFLMAGASCERLHSSLAALGGEPVVGILALGKLLDTAAAAERVRRRAKGTLDARIDSEEGATLIGPEGAHELAARELFELLFAPRGERTSVEACERATGASLGRLPLPIYLWGLDSI